MNCDEYLPFRAKESLTFGADVVPFPLKQMNHGRTAGRIIGVPLASCLVCHKSGHQQKHDGFHCARMNTSVWQKHNWKIARRNRFYMSGILIENWGLCSQKRHIRYLNLLISKYGWLSWLTCFSLPIWVNMITRPCTLTKLHLTEVSLRCLPSGLRNSSSILEHVFDAATFSFPFRDGK